MPTYLNKLKIRSTQNIGETLQILTEVFKNNTNALSDVIQLSGRYNRYNKDKHSGTVSTSDLNQEINQIDAAIIHLFNQITEEEAAAYELENAIFQSILVVCQSPEREAAMRKLFPGRYFKGVEYDISGLPRPVESVNQFDLIVFDNSLNSDPKDPHELLRYYLNETKPFLLYFGALYLKWLGDVYPQKAYFANSIFSIHNRLDDMIKYLKYTQE